MPTETDIPVRSDDGARRVPLAWRITPLLILAVGGTCFAILRPGAILQGATSLRTLLIMGGALLLGAVIWWLVRRFVRRPLLAETIGVLPLAAIMVWSMLLPLVQGPIRVDDQSPAGVTLSAPSGSAEPVDEPVAPEPAPSTPAAAAEPVLLGSDALTGIDHDASGTVGLVQLADGALLVRLENFTVESGPDYHVYLVPGTGAQVPDGGSYLGPLEETEGNKNYDVPAGAVAEGPVTVLVWCMAFGVPVANATVR